MEELAKYEGQDKVSITTDQKELIKRTVANGATDEELKLFIYDCTRRGVHPLDKLIHFTKRRGKYVPITSIDFMRTRAAETGEYAGNDDAVFHGAGDNNTPNTATVTVYRVVMGQRCPFTATARWKEYKPDEDFMWKKMPYTMLGKCAEALALRKAFPQQLAGLYDSAEMDQAGPSETKAPPIKKEPDKNEPAETSGNPFVLTPILYHKESKNTAGKMVYWITGELDGNEQSFSTFDKKVMELAASETGTNVLLRLEYIERKVGDKTYLNIVSLTHQDNPQE
jgi:phage recombination protein Bet